MASAGHGGKGGGAGGGRSQQSIEAAHSDRFAAAIAQARAQAAVHAAGISQARGGPARAQLGGSGGAAGDLAPTAMDQSAAATLARGSQLHQRPPGARNTSPIIRDGQFPMGRPASLSELG